MKKKKAELLKLEEQRKEEERQRELREQRERNILKIQTDTKESSIRKATLEDSDAHFENLLKKVRAFKKPLKIEEEWKKFLKCGALPDTDIPRNIRNFIFQFQHDFIEHFEKNINWWLRCNDRSVLTQIITIPDTRRKLIEKLRQPSGKFFDRKLRMLAKVFQSIDETLRRKKVSSEHLKEIVEIRDFLRDMAFKFLDVLTLEVTMHIDREMKSMTPLSAHYSYASPDFVKYVWSFKDVTLPKTYEKLKNIKIEPLNMQIKISNLIDLKSTVVRGMWFKHDFYSDYCPSFNPTHEMEFTTFSEDVAREMKVKDFMRNKHLDEMRKRRELYDIAMEEKRKAEEENAKNNKKGDAVQIKSKPKQKGKKRAKFTEELEPPVVDEATYIDVEQEYEDYENSKVDDEHESLSPDNFSLEKDDVNMRECQILGGVFKLECMHLPLQTKEINYQMFVRINKNPNILSYKSFHHIYKPAVLKAVKDERKSVFAQKALDAREKALLDLIRVEIKLPDNIYWWETPTVCRWEPWEESEEFISLDDKLKDYNLNYDTYVRREQEKLFKNKEVRHYMKNLEIQDFQIDTHPEVMKLSELVKHYLVPIMPEEFKMFVDRLEEFEVKQRSWRLYKEKQELLQNDAYNEMKEASINVALSLEEFLRCFEKMHEQPRTLFPVKTRCLINLCENTEVAEMVKEAREKLQKIKMLEYEIDIGQDVPLKDEPMILSELIEKIDNVQNSLVPIFRDLPEPESEKVEDNDENLAKKRKPSKIKKLKNRNLSTVSNKSRKSKLSAQKIELTNNESEDEVESSSRTSAVEEEEAVKLTLIPHCKGKWSTKDIYEQSFDASTKILTFYTGRLGTFAFASKKYQNFPFKFWELYPVTEFKSEIFMILKIVCKHFTIEFKITNRGYTFKVIKPLKGPLQEIRKPVKIYELKKILSAVNMNLFSEIDATWYIDACEKHHSMELHAYKTFANYCLSYHFMHDEENCIANRRQIILKIRGIEMKNAQRVLITPMRVVSIDDIRENNGEFKIDPPEQDFFPDLLDFLKTSVDKNVHRVNQQNFMLIWFVQVLLMNIRPLSFSK